MEITTDASLQEVRALAHLLFLLAIPADEVEIEFSVGRSISFSHDRIEGTVHAPHYSSKKGGLKGQKYIDFQWTGDDEKRRMGVVDYTVDGLVKDSAEDLLSDLCEAAWETERCFASVSERAEAMDWV